MKENKVHITSFPADCGDSYLCEFEIGGSTYSILVDAGTPAAGKTIAKFLKKDGTCPKIDLLVVTHIDNDHIGGVIKLLEDREINDAIQQIWFNGYTKLIGGAVKPFQSLSVAQGDELDEALRNDARWNASFNHGLVSLQSDGKPSCIDLGEGANIQILSPGAPQLDLLRSNWEEAIEEQRKSGKPKKKSKIQRFSAGKDIRALAGKKFYKDGAYANGSSIAFLLTVADRRLLFTGDAFPNVICDAAQFLSEDPIPIDVFKLSHHGSAKNTDLRIVEKFPATHYFVSTDGTHDHPNDETIARILVGAQSEKTIYFNYPGVLKEWGAVDLANEWKCKLKFGDGVSPLRIEISEKSC